MFEALFPPPVTSLPQADIPLPGVTAYLSQAPDHQIIFMVFSQDIDLPEHAHAAQWGVVFEGRIDLIIDGVFSTFRKGDRYFIPAGVKHSGKIYAGYADMTYFDQPDRYACKGN
ncbi:MAG: cupin domain-containing protein [Anaerolineae bacterium]|nr:cupin domain-containing protein [Anaerolineae bacterium]